LENLGVDGNNIKTSLKEIRMNFIHLTCEHGIESSVSIRGREFLDQLTDY